MSDKPKRPHTGEVGSPMHELLCNDVISAMNVIIDRKIKGVIFEMPLLGGQNFRVTIERIEQ